MCRADLSDLVRRFHRIKRRKAKRHRSRLEWRRPGTVWAADFKDRREPIEGRYRVANDGKAQLDSVRVRLSPAVRGSDITHYCLPHSANCDQTAS